MMTIPHSGEVIPEEAVWLRGIDPLILLTDVDRFVHELYIPACEALQIPFVKAECHRYVVDLNRLPTDVDPTLVEGAAAVKTAFVSGFHWARTTQGQALLTKPLTRELHQALTLRYHDSFHSEVEAVEARLFGEQKARGVTTPVRFHIDAHSMPSVGTGAHQDAGTRRPDIVVSDCSGKSCEPAFKDAVIAAYEEQGFQVSYNWPYLGGRLTERYGKPGEGRHSVQVELNRGLYMNEVTREHAEGFVATAVRIASALGVVRRWCGRRPCG